MDNGLKTVQYYLYHGQVDSGATSRRLAPVNPDTGKNTRSVFGLNPHFFKYGISLSLHSSYLQTNKQTLARQWFSSLLLELYKFSHGKVSAIKKKKYIMLAKQIKSYQIISKHKHPPGKKWS